MKSYILQPNHVRGLGNVVDNEDSINGFHCRVDPQDSTVEFEEVTLKTYYMGTGTELTITFITASLSILPNDEIHLDVMVTDEEGNPVSGVDLYIYENETLVAQLETDNDGLGVGDEMTGFDFSSPTSGKHILKCVLPRQDTYFESVKEIVINVFEGTTLTISCSPDEIDTFTESVTLYGTLLNENSEGIVGELVKFYNCGEYLGEGITDDNGVATLTTEVSSLHDCRRDHYITLYASRSQVNYGESCDLWFESSTSDEGEAPEGIYELYIDGTLYSSVDCDGSPTFGTSGLSVGSHTAYISFLGNEWYLPAISNEIVLKVRGIPDLEVSDYTGVYGSASLPVRLTYNSSPVANNLLSMYIGGSLLFATTDSNGRANFDLSQLDNATYSDIRVYCEETDSIACIYEVVDITILSSIDFYQPSYYSKGTGNSMALDNGDLKLTSVAHRWLNQEFVGNDDYLLEFDLVLLKNNRQGFLFGSNPDSNLKSGFGIYRDVSNTCIETYDSSGEPVSIVNNLSSSYFSTGTHHVSIDRIGDDVTISIDNDRIYVINDMQNYYNTIGLFIWGGNSIKVSNVQFTLGKDL